MKAFGHFLFLPALLLFPDTARANGILNTSNVIFTSLALFVAVLAVGFVGVLALLLLRGLKVAAGGGHGDLEVEKATSQEDVSLKMSLWRVVRAALWISGAWCVLWTGVLVTGWRYEASSMRGKSVKANLGAIRGAQVAYFAEWAVWVGNQPPTPVADRRGNKELVPWDNATRFSLLGFAPEGKVWCSYSLEGPDRPTEAEGFTARAECDADTDGNISVYWITNQDTEIRHSGATF